MFDLTNGTFFQCSLTSQIFHKSVAVKLEEMNEAEPFLFQMLNFTSAPRYEPMQKGKYKKTYESYYKGISTENINQLHDIYRADIELFGYPSTPFGTL